MLSMAGGNLTDKKAPVEILMIKIKAITMVAIVFSLFDK